MQIFIKEKNSKKYDSNNVNSLILNILQKADNDYIIQQNKD